MAVVRETGYIYWRDLRVWLGQPLNLISSVFFAAFFFVFFGAPLSRVAQLPGFPAPNYQAFIAPMVLVQSVVVSGSDAGYAMLTDILSGYFDKLLLAPINRFSILLSSLLMAGTRALLQSLVIVGLALAFGVSFKGGVLGLVAVVVLVVTFGFAWSSVGLIVALRTKNAQVTQSVWLFFFPFAFLTSAFMPKELLSGWFKVAVTVNPVDYVMQGVRAIIIHGWEWGPILTGVWVLTAMFVVLTATATWFYRRATT